MARPVRIKVPYGSLLNPRPPAPVRARMIPAYRVFNAVMKALAQALARIHGAANNPFDPVAARAHGGGVIMNGFDKD